MNPHMQNFCGMTPFEHTLVNMRPMWFCAF